MIRKLLTAAILICTGVQAIAQTDKTPAQVYDAYRAAVHNAKSPDDIMQFQAKTNKKSGQSGFAEKLLVQGFWEIYKTMTPKNVKLKSERAEGDTTFLTYDSLDADRKGTIVVEMVKETEGWKVLGESQYLGSAVPPQKTAVKTTNWDYAAATAPFSQTPVAGKLYGAPFQPKDFRLYVTRVRGVAAQAGVEGGTILSLGDSMMGDESLSLSLYGLPKGEYQNGQVSQAATASKGPHVSELEIKSKRAGNKESRLKPGQFGVRLSFGQINSQKLLPGYIVVRAGNDTYLDGYFYAKVLDPDR